MESESVASPIEILSEPPKDSQYDNFYTPKNYGFYSKQMYAELDTTKHEIRLLRMRPLSVTHDESTPISCDFLDNIPLATVKGKYTTISYCAGDPKATEEISVNGAVFNVFSNLGHALRQALRFWKARLPHQELLLWVDQVCIDQSNLSERSNQVSFMGDIYSGAEQVLVCLSVEGDIGGGIAWLCSLPQDLPQDYDFQDEDEAEDDPTLRKQEAFLYSNWHYKDFHLGWHAFIRTILNSRWWSRAWIRQEFIRSPKAVFLAANESTCWKDVAMAMEFYYTAAYGFEIQPPDFHEHLKLDHGIPDTCQACLLGEDPSLFWKAGKRVHRLLSAKEAYESDSDGSRDLLTILRDAHLCDATDPRDLIYAFFGLSLHSYDIRPEYSPDICLQDVLLQLACLQCAFAQQKLRYLAICISYSESMASR